MRVFKSKFKCLFQIKNLLRALCRNCTTPPKKYPDPKYIQTPKKVSRPQKTEKNLPTHLQEEEYFQGSRKHIEEDVLYVVAGVDIDLARFFGPAVLLERVGVRHLFDHIGFVGLLGCRILKPISLEARSLPQDLP